jgi:hypothetical protein
VRVEPVETTEPAKKHIDESADQSFLERYREFIGVADDLPSDLADQHDHYLYGTPKK